MADLVLAAGMGGSCLLTSQSLPGLRPAQALGLPIGWVVESDPGDPATLDLDALSLHAHLATPALVRACRRAGVETHVWTVNREAEMRRLIDLGVTAIITDAPVFVSGGILGGSDPACAIAAPVRLSDRLRSREKRLTRAQTSCGSGGAPIRQVGGRTSREMSGPRSNSSSGSRSPPTAAASAASTR